MVSCIYYRDALNVKVSELLTDDDVELRADETGRTILAELKELPKKDLPSFLVATREIMSVARQLAAQRSAAALGGEPRQIGQLADLWNHWDDSGRDKALDLLRLINRE